MIAPNPVVVVEVVTQASRAVDTGFKLADYFSVPSMRHCLVVATERQIVVHHARRAGDGSKARGTGDGVLVTRVISDSGNAVATPGEADDRR